CFGNLTRVRTGSGSDGVLHIQNIFLFKVTFFRNVVIEIENSAVAFAENFYDFRRSPDKKPPFDALAVCILRRIKTATRIKHFPPDVFESFSCCPPKEFILGDLIKMQVDADQLSVVVEHLLEMRNETDRIYRITVEAAAELIIDPSIRHLLCGLLYDLQGSFITGSFPITQQEFQTHRRRKLRSTTKSSVGCVEGPVETR